MSSSKPWGTESLQNATPILRSSNIYQGPGASIGRSGPVLPPRPANNMYSPGSGSYSSYNMPYNSSGYGSSYGGYGGYGGVNSYNSYGSYGMPSAMPYRNSMYNSYNSMGMYGMGTGMGMPGDDAERRFIQYAEENSRRTFANVESIVRAFNSMAMMLDNTFFAMTSSFRAVLSVADNFGRLRTMFGHIWYSVNIFRLFSWLYRKMRELLGYKVTNTASSIAWKQAAGSAAPKGDPSSSSWPTLAFLGVLVSAPYIISKFLPKFEDKSDPTNWNTPGLRAKAAFDFVESSPSEMSLNTNDEIFLAPPYIQEEMSLKNSGWAYAVGNGKCGTVPLNYLLINKSKPIPKIVQPALKSSINNNNESAPKTHTKRVSFGENQIFDIGPITGEEAKDKDSEPTNTQDEDAILNKDSQNISLS